MTVSYRRLSYETHKKKFHMAPYKSLIRMAHTHVQKCGIPVKKKRNKLTKKERERELKGREPWEKYFFL